MAAERNIVVRAIDYAKDAKLKLAAGATLLPAAFLSACAGSEAKGPGVEVTLVPSSPTADATVISIEPTATPTPEPKPTLAPTPTAEPTPEARIVTAQTISVALDKAYESGRVPAGLCTRQIIQRVIDEAMVIKAQEDNSKDASGRPNGNPALYTGRFGGAYGELLKIYNETALESVKAAADELATLYVQSWMDFYKARNQDPKQAEAKLQGWINANNPAKLQAGVCNISFNVK